MNGALRVLLVDDHALVLAGIRLMIERIDGVTVLAEAFNGHDAVALATMHRPDLVLMDISMKDLNGIDAMRQIMAEAPATRVLILSSHMDVDHVRQAIRAGAAGYLVKGCPHTELAIAIRAIAEGNTYLTPAISAHVMSDLQDRDEQDTSPLAALSARQREVLQMIAEGNSTKEIAFVLNISPKTAETHRGALMDRLDIHTVAGLTLFAARHGLVEIDRLPGPGQRVRQCEPLGLK